MYSGGPLEFSSNTQYQLDRSPKSKPNVNFRFRFEKLLVWLPAAVLIFFIAGLLYLLRCERVDNLGAYRIPSETGTLIPSDFNNYARWQPRKPDGHPIHIRPQKCLIWPTNCIAPREDVNGLLLVFVHCNGFWYSAGQALRTVEKGKGKVPDAMFF
jgi:hypothetical protein